MILRERRALLDGFRRGDRAALLEVYRHYVPIVSRFLLRGFSFESNGRTLSFRGFRGGYEIEATLQEVFRRAFEEKARLAYNGLDPYQPYLLRIARNLVLNDLKAKQPILFRYRQGGPVLLESAEGPVDELPPVPPDAADRLEAEEVAQLVANFRASLDTRELGVFQARFEEGLAAERVAERLSLTRSQVRTTETKLRARFLEHMRSAGYLEHYRPLKVAAGAGALGVVLLLLFGGAG